MHVWSVVHVARGKYRMQKLRKNVAICAPSHNFVWLIFTIKACIDNWIKLVKQQYVIRMSSQCGKLHPTNDWDRLASFGHPSKFQRISCLGFLTAPTSLSGGQLNFAWCLAISWAGTLYIHYGHSCLLMEFCQVQYSLCVQVLLTLILAALLRGTWATSLPKFVAWYKEWNYGIFAPRHFQQRAQPIFRGWPSLWA